MKKKLLTTALVAALAVSGGALALTGCDDGNNQRYTITYKTTGADDKEIYFTGTEFSSEMSGGDSFSVSVYFGPMWKHDGVDIKVDGVSVTDSGKFMYQSMDDGGDITSSDYDVSKARLWSYQVKSVKGDMEIALDASGCTMGTYTLTLDSSIPAGASYAFVKSGVEHLLPSNFGTALSAETIIQGNTIDVPADNNGIVFFINISENIATVTDNSDEYSYGTGAGRALAFGNYYIKGGTKYVYCVGEINRSLTMYAHTLKTYEESFPVPANLFNILVNTEAVTVSQFSDRAEFADTTYNDFTHGDKTYKYCGHLASGSSYYDKMITLYEHPMYVGDASTPESDPWYDRFTAGNYASQGEITKDVVYLTLSTYLTDNIAEDMDLYLAEDAFGKSKAVDITSSMITDIGSGKVLLTIKKSDIPSKYITTETCSPEGNPSDSYKTGNLFLIAKPKQAVMQDYIEVKVESNYENKSDDAVGRIVSAAGYRYIDFKLPYKKDDGAGYLGYIEKSKLFSGDDYNGKLYIKLGHDISSDDGNYGSLAITPQYNRATVKVYNSDTNSEIFKGTYQFRPEDNNVKLLNIANGITKNVKSIKVVVTYEQKTTDKTEHKVDFSAITGDVYISADPTAALENWTKVTSATDVKISAEKKLYLLCESTLNMYVKADVENEDITYETKIAESETLRDMATKVIRHEKDDKTYNVQYIDISGLWLDNAIELAVKSAAV